ncbi:MAG: hypothetical protein ACR2NN_07620 [Bryobacteraceae bacterium]
MKSLHYLLASLLVLLLPSHKTATAQQSAAEADRTPAKCSIQISSVTVDPKETHQGSPESYLATVTVQVAVLCVPPPRSTVATVGILTGSSEPLGNNVRYEDYQTLPLTESPTIFRFKVFGSRRTVPGHLIIHADILAATAGITVKEAAEPSNDRTRLDITAPWLFKSIVR